MSWAHYILQVNIYLIVFYGFYKIFLEKETYFVLNRVYLISAGLLSAALPFLRFEWFMRQPLAQPVYSSVGQMNDYISVAIVQENVSRITLGNALAFLYFAGVLFFVIRFIVQLMSVRSLVKNKDRGFAFSFFSKKVIDVSLPEFRTINSHEEIHVRQLHSLDVILFEVLGIMSWFNPIIYFYKHSIKNIHEYLADEEAARYQGDKEKYALLLLSTAFGVTPSNLTNSFFNKSMIKKRIYMLHKQRSKKTAVLKYGLFLPLFAVALVMSSATIRKNDKLLAVAEKLPLSEPLNIITEAVTEAADYNTENAIPSANSIVSKLPILEDPSGPAVDWSNLFNHLKSKLRYPPAATVSQTQGFTMIQFSVENGEAKGVSVSGPSLGEGTDAEVMSKILSFSDFKAIPDGKYAIKVSFTISEANSEKKNIDLRVPKGYIYVGEVVVRTYLPKTTIAANDPADTRVYDFVSLETQPTFQGGMDKFYDYLKKNIRYPSLAQANRVEGKVFLSFVVEKDGSLVDIKVDRKLGSGTDEEAVRLLKECPKWQPGTQNGKVVRVKYNIPINFSLESKMSIKVSAPENSSSTVQQVSDFVASPTQEDKVHDFTSLDQAPTFPGGMTQFYQFLKRTVVYPKEAQDKNIQGKVFLSFTVEKDGALSNIKIDRKLGGGTDEEAIRVMKLSPHWIPGLIDKKPVRVKYNIPLSFTLSK